MGRGGRRASPEIGRRRDVQPQERGGCRRGRGAPAQAPSGRLASLLFDPLYLDAWIKTRCLSHSATSQGDEKPKLGSCPCHPLPRLDRVHPRAPGGPRPTLSPWLGQWPGTWSCPQATWEGLSLQLLKGDGASDMRSLAWSLSLGPARLAKVPVSSGTPWSSRNGVFGPHGQR